jgi:hypothetical protein
MFTMKWMAAISAPGVTGYRCIAASEFEVANRNGETFVYMSQPNRDSFEWKVEPGAKVYVINDAGKTIDTIHGTQPYGAGEAKGDSSFVNTHAGPDTTIG